ncbi:MAG TPA: hypothetical protein DCY74_10495 [Clostridiales bacterium]|jgi:cell division protein FtsB|nr:hypothetical protein [Clostridiales bacterium]HBE14587.1 hypothetical protein [Clostridiales bacterium]HCG36654.1 hypothetical protein [Clostridiales bacterium]
MKKKFSFLTKFTIFSALCFTAFLIFQQHVQNKELSLTYANLLEERNGYQETNDYLTAKISEENLDEEIVKSIAKDKLNFREEGIIIFANNLPN